MSIRHATTLLALACAALACGGEQAAPPGVEPLEDAGLVRLDAGGLADAGPDDAGGADAGSAGEDAGHADAGPLDAGSADAGESADCPPLVHDGPADEYSAIEHLRDGALRDALYRRVRDHFPLNYDGAKHALFGPSGIDVHDGMVECVYTGQLFRREKLDANDGYNVEHSWPQSQFPAETGPKSDLHHLFAAERNANSSRGSLPYGETDCSVDYCRFQEGGSEIGPRTGTTQLVFEVRPERRGDIARAHFYFAVRYDMYIPGYEEEALKRWNRCDPPDALERARNDAIERAQHNRNPFVDRPELVDAIADF